MAVYADKPGVAVCARVLLILTLSSCVQGLAWAASDTSTKPKRPQIPWGVTGLNSIQIGAYDSKAQPTAEVLQARTEMDLKGWEVIRKYYPQLGVITEGRGTSINPRDPHDERFYAVFATEDPGRSPIPLISMICSLENNDATGKLKALRAELLDAVRTEDYSTWSLERLKQTVRAMTQELTTAKGTKYRAPKKTLTFQETVQLYEMTVVLIDRDPKWENWQEQVKKLGYAAPPLPDMHDFSRRLTHQTPILIPPGATRAFLLYRPGWDISQPVTKEEYEERADVVLVKRTGTMFRVEQFPIYLTNDQQAWNPDWIQPQDEIHDTTLMARKFYEQWTRFDGPYLWFKKDQLTGEDTYHATVNVSEGRHRYRR